MLLCMWMWCYSGRSLKRLITTSLYFFFVQGVVMGKNSEEIATKEVIPEEITPEKIIPSLERAEVYLARSIYVSDHLLEYHPADAAVLFSHAKHLNITMPPRMEEKVEKFILEQFSTNYENLPFKNLVPGLSYLLLRGCELENLSYIVEYIFSFQNEKGGIGSYKGDVGRIPNTAGFLSSLLSEKHVNGSVFKEYEDRILKACNFIVYEWNKDFSSGMAVSHKGAYVVGTLLKCLHLNLKVQDLADSIKNAVKALLDLQLDNGSWTYLPKMSKKRIKLASSSPNITALALYSLCDVYLKEKSTLLGELSETVYNAIKEGCTYLCKSQTAFGFWYAHSIAESNVIAGECALALKRSLEVLRDGS